MPSPYSKRVTLHDVAEQAGVSYQTVSRVINENPHVSKDTRQRVLRVIKELNYQPNHAARSLVTRRSNLLEVITFGSHHYGPSQMVAHVERAARRLGYNLILSHIIEMSVDEIRAAINSLSGRLVDGLIMVTPVVGLDYDDLMALCQGIPFVMIDPQLGSITPSVVINQHYGSQLATGRLSAAMLLPSISSTMKRRSLPWSSRMTRWRWVQCAQCANAAYISPTIFL
jgi:DNA-binding LacI/PurR family transcriptional regulator